MYRTCEILCGGVAIEDVKFRNLPKLHNETDVMALEFIPFFQKCTLEVSTILFVYLQILAENLNTTLINIVEVSDNENKEIDLTSVIKFIHKIFAIDIQHKVISRNQCINGHYKSEVDVFIVSNLSTDQELCDILKLVVPNGAFLISKENYATNLQSNKPELYQVLCAQYALGQHFQLIRWRLESAPITTTASIVRSSSDLSLLASTLTTLPQQYRVFIVTSYPYIDGFKALVQKWRKNRSLIHVFASNHEVFEDKSTEQFPSNALAFNVLKDKQCGGWFYVPLRQKQCNTSDISLQYSHVGDFRSLHWIQKPKIIGQGIEVFVHYTGINNIDIKRSAGIISQDVGQNPLGMDFSGITENGNRVMGLIKGGAASSRVWAHPDLLWPVPEHWSLEDAATVPLAYSIAYYCLCIKFRLYRNMSLLVHGGAGALGQAIISIALGNGCTVFTTVSDMSKKRFIRKLFPQLKDDYIGHSRDDTFGDMVLTKTNGKGCNVVISCVTDKLINTSLKCAASSGITFDLNHIATRDNYSFEMCNLNKDRNYAMIDFPKILTQENLNVIKKLLVLVSEGIKRGYVRPLSRVIYSTLDTQRAFRFVASSRHRGRALLQLKVDAGNEFLQSESRLHCSTDNAHLILCNDDYFGLTIAERLVKRGARKVYMHGLRKSSYVDFEIQTIKKLGVHVKISNQSLNCKDDINKLLKDCVNLGEIEGIYVVMTKNQSLSKNNVLQGLDLITRRLCTNLKYFGIVCGEQDIGFDISIARAQDKLPVTFIKLPSRNETEYESIFYKEYINSFEYALTRKEPILDALELSNKSRSLLEDITHVADIKLPSYTEENMTLADLNLESGRSHIICAYLRDHHNVYLSEKDIPSLTIKRILEMNEIMTDSGFKETKGLATFYSYVDPDELLVATEMTFLPTIVSNSNMRDDEFDVTQTYLSIIPGLEGHYERFRTLCERLKIPAIILQPGLERPDETVSSLAKRFAEVLLKKAGLNKKFYLIGYESGSLVALEMAAILEDHGLTGTVFLIGQSPNRFQETLKETLEQYQNEEELQIAIALHMCNLMVGGLTDGLEDKLRTTSTWPEKVEICVRSVMGRVPHSAQYARETIECAYGRIKQVQAYRPTPQSLRSRLILIQANSSSEDSDDSMQSYSQQPVSVCRLRAPLAHSAKDLRCAAVINNHLDSEILEAFEKKNLCDSYLSNADKFMTVD